MLSSRHLVLVVTLMLFGCRDRALQRPADLDAGVASDSAVSQGVVVVDPTAGGEIAVAGAAVTVPPGAVSQPKQIAVAEVQAANAPFAPASDSDMPPLPTSIVRTGGVFALTPHGTEFQVPIAIKIPIDTERAAKPDRSLLRLYTSSPGGTWAPVAGATVDGDHLVATVSHFSFFVVGFEAPLQAFPPVSTRAVDFLFVIDTSQSMAPAQQHLVQEFPVFMNTLKSLPGGLPSIHVGIVSADMGAGPETGVPGCRPGGDGGLLQATARNAGCSAPRGAFISETGTTRNFDGTIDDAFSCIATLGDQGCGFEHQLESAATALGFGGAIPAANAGFLRPDAYLAVVFITNEDDCSAPPDTSIFSPASRQVSDPLGPLGSFRCNEFGHLCGGSKLARSAAPALQDCQSAEDGVLRRVSEMADFFKALKPDPAMVYMSAITGPVTPYGVTMIASNGAGGITEDQPNVSHSCTAASGVYADPAVRLAEFIGKFGDTGMLESICNDSYAPALTKIASALADPMGPRCLQPALATLADATSLLSASCRVVERTPNAANATTEVVLPRCVSPTSTGDPDPCWHIAANLACADAGELRVSRGTAVPPGAVLTVTCAP